MGPLYDEAAAISDVDGDGVADTLTVTGQDVTVSLDNNNVAHVAVGGIREVNDGNPSLAMGYFFGDEGIWYWNENNPTWTVVAAVEDLSTPPDGIITLPDSVAGQAAGAPGPPYGGYGFFNMSLHPSIGFDAGNDVYLAYATVNETADTTVFAGAHRHIYVIRSGNAGTNFGAP